MISDKKPRRHEEVAAQLRIFIADRHLSAGARLPGEYALAMALSTTRPTLRAGLRALNMSGEIETRLGAGSFVSAARKPISINIADTPGPMELLMARLTIEPRIAGEAAELANASDLWTLQQILSEMRDATDVLWYDHLYRAFHLSVAAAAKQMVIADLIGGLIDGMNSRILRPGRALAPGDDLRDHVNLLKALHMRSVQAAASAMRDHLRGVQERMFGEHATSSCAKSMGSHLRQSIRRGDGARALSVASEPIECSF